MEAHGVTSAQEMEIFEDAKVESIDMKEVTEHLQELCFDQKHIKMEEDVLNAATDFPVSGTHHYSRCRMQVFVKAAQIGRILVLDLVENDSVYCVKAKIQEKEGIPANQQTLLFKGNCLADNLCLGPYHIFAGTTLAVVFQEEHTTELFLISVKLPNEETLGLEVEKWYTIDCIKDMINKLAGFQKDQQVLIFKEEPLENRRSLAQCDIQKGALLVLSVTLEVGEKSLLVPIMKRSRFPVEDSNMKKMRTSLHPRLPKYYKECPVLNNVVKGHGDEDNKMQIFVRNQKGKTVLLSVLRTNTIRDVKAKIEEKEKYPQELQKLHYGGRRLEDEQTLADYNIEKESTLNLGLLAAELPIRMMEQNYYRV